MGISKKREKRDVSFAEMTEDEALEELVNVVTDSLKDSSETLQEPFEGYTLKVRRHFYDNSPALRSRVVAGYRVLLKELEDV